MNLLPHLRGEIKSAPHDRLFWRTGTGQKGAVREGDWKLVREEHQPDQIYNLPNDPGESKNLATEEPVRLKELAAALDSWEKEMPAPAFIGTSRNEQAARAVATSPSAEPVKKRTAPTTP